MSSITVTAKIGPGLEATETVLNDVSNISFDLNNLTLSVKTGINNPIYDISGVSGITFDISSGNYNINVNGNGGGNGVNYIHQATLLLDNSQILTLPTTPIEIVPAPGEGKLLIHLQSVWKKDFSAGSYSNNSGFCAGFIQWGDTSFASGALLSPGAANNTINLLTSNYFVPDQSGTFGEYLAQAQELPINERFQVTITTDNGLDLGGGNAVNTLRITVTYMIIDTETGLLVSTS